MSHNSINILCKGLSGLSIIKRVRLIAEQVKGYTCRYLKMMREGINPVFHTWVIIKHVIIKVPELRSILL